MSTGRIMTLSVQSLNKLYFLFIETHLLPLLPQNHPHVTKLLQQRSAYEVHRFLEDLLSTSPDSIVPSLNGSVGNLSNKPLAATNTNLYNFSLNSSTEQPKTYNDHRSFDNSLQKKSDEKKSTPNKMGLRKALTGTNFQQRIKQYKIPQPEEKSNQASLAQSVGNDSLLPVPSLGSQSLSNDFKVDYQISGSGLNGSLSNADKKTKEKTMKQCVEKISKLFNDNHSKIQKYSKKVQSQNKLYTLNFSTKIEKKDEGGKLPQYQFQLKGKF